MFDEMLQRTTLQNIIEFVMHGVDGMPSETITLETKVRNAENSIMQTIEKKILNTNERDTVIGLVSDALGDIEKAFFEAGFKAGAKTLSNIIEK